MILLPQKVAYRGTISSLRISAVDGTAFIDNLSGATLDLGSSVVNATGTAAIRISSVDGTAFVDTSDATLAAALAANAGKYLVITDASGRYLKGWIKAAGTGETLGDELTTEFTNVNYDTFTPSGIQITAIETGGQAANARMPVLSLPAGKVYKFVVSGYTHNSGSTPILYIATENALIRYTDGTTIIGNKTGYYTGITASTFPYLFTTGNTNYVVSVSHKQVLTPSTSGSTIVSAKQGATQNFTSKSASFIYNEAAYHCRVKRLY